MTMTMRERILSIYRGETPDVVPYMLDLSHWFYHKNRMPWDLTVAYDQPEYELIAYHKQAGAGFYMPNLGSFYSVAYGDDVQSDVSKVDHDGVPEIAWRLTTPLGSIERRRMWEEVSYSWAITRWGVQTEQDLRVLGYALGSRTYAPLWDRYQAWVDEVGDMGVVYLSAGYSAMGHLLNYWLGVSGTAYAAADWPATLREVVDQINDNNLKMIDLLAASPAEIIILGDNFSSDLQPPRFFGRWSRPFYAEAIRRLHAAGKYVAVHIDGRLRGAIGMIRDAGADCGDAITPCADGRPDPGPMPRGRRAQLHPVRRCAAQPVAARSPPRGLREVRAGLAGVETLWAALHRQRRRPGPAARGRRTDRDHARSGGEARPVLGR